MSDSDDHFTLSDEDGEISDASIELAPKPSLKQQSKPQLSLKTGISSLKRSMSEIAIKQPFKRQVLKPSNSNDLSKPFKVRAEFIEMPTFVKKTDFNNGCLRPGTSLGMRRVAKMNIYALYDPDSEDSFVLYRPKNNLSETEKQARIATLLGKTPDFEVEVVVDPVLAAVLRPHQKAGVQFLFDCTTGRKAPNAYGCIMADEMVY
jgi:DNA repair and recombination RAD54-like protein